MIFINTRPIIRADLLTHALQAQGIKVLPLPLLELQPLAIHDYEQKYQQNFISSDYYKALVVVSPSAARLGVSFCPQNFIPQCEVIAVGQATAEVLREAGWQVSCPNEASNEGMMQMSVLASLKASDKVLIWRGRGGRRLLVNFLQDKEVNVDAIAWYQRQCPKDLLLNFQDIQSQLPKPHTGDSSVERQYAVVLISSGEAFSHWRSLLDDIQTYRLSDFKYLTFGKRLTDTLTNLSLICEQISNLDADEVWHHYQLLHQKSG